MPDWTHLIRFIAVEDSLVHLGQLVDITRDIGRDSVDGVKIAAYVIEGTIFDGKVTKDILHVKQVSVSPNFNGNWKTDFSSCCLLSRGRTVTTFDAWDSITPTMPM